MKRIAILDTGFSTKFGGGQRVGLDMVTALKDHYKVDIVTLDPIDPNLAPVPTRSVLPFQINAFTLYKRLLMPLVYRKAAKYDLIIDNSGAAIVPRHSKQPILVYIHDEIFDVYERKNNKYQQGLWKWYIAPYMAILKRLRHLPASGVITNSKYTQTIIKSRYDVNSILCYPGVDPPLTHVSDRSGVITVSRFTPEKNLDFVARVITLNNASGTILGSAYTPTAIKYYNQLRTRYNNLNISRNVDKLYRDRCLAHAKVFISASYEGFGLAVAEAILAGCIPLVPDVSAHKETVPFATLRYPYGDEHAAKVCMQNALAGKYDHLLSKLQKHIRQFTMAKFYARLRELVLCALND